MTNGFMDESEVKEIPTPDQMPRRLDLGQLPVSVLRSGAVEALAQQNEDLMARLAVAIRRGAALENQIAHLENLLNQARHETSQFHDKALVLQEKDRILSERYNQQLAEVNQTQDRLQLLEIQFAELYATSQEKQRTLKLELEISSKKSSRLERYRKKVSKLARNLKTVVDSLTQRLQREELISRELKSKLGEAGLRIQAISSEHSSQQKQLVDNYETSLSELRNEIQELQKQNQAYHEKQIELKAYYEKFLVSENQLIGEKRQHQEYRELRERESALLQSELSDLRVEYKAKLIEVENLRNQMIQAQTDLNKNGQQIKGLTDQVETLQLLWQEGQREQESLKSKNQALQNLNQQLSGTINQQRHELAQLRHKLENEGISTSEKIKEIKGHLQMITPSNIDFVETSEATQSTESTRILSRIDTLIAEIQSGFKRQPLVDTAPESSIETESSSANDNRGI